MKLLIVGGVAAGATAAAKARRISEEAEITLIDRGPYVSFANCGLPYYIAGDIKKRSDLLLQTPDGFLGRYNVNVLLETAVVEIDRQKKKVKILGPEGEAWLAYDKLLLAQGGSPIIPPIPGKDAPHVFQLWTVPDMDKIHGFIKEKTPKTAIIVGGGFIGLEMAEALHSRGIHTSIVELAPQLMNVMDPDIAQMVKTHLQDSGIEVCTQVSLVEVLEKDRKVLLSNGKQMDADLVLMSVGVKSDLSLVKQAGLTLGETGNLLVDEFMQTSDPDIYAAGDMVEVIHKVTGKKVKLPLAGPANRQGRLAAINLLGGHEKYRGVLGTSVVKVLDHTAAMTGLTEKYARILGYDFGTAIIHKDHHAGYYPDAKILTLKLIYDRQSGVVLGAQAWGEAGVEKRIDVIASALQGKLTLEDLAEMDLSYAPPYSSANDPVNLAAFVGMNDLSGFSPLVTSGKFLLDFDSNKDILLDVRNLGEYLQGHHPKAVNIPVDELRYRLEEIPKDKTVYLYCKVGYRGHLALRILKGKGWRDVYNITGGYESLKTEIHFEEEK